MKKTFCTIITADHFPKALALYQSLQAYNPSITLQVLVADNVAVNHDPLPQGINLVNANSLSGYALVDKLYEKYGYTDIDSFRWSLKPVFISYLLNQDFGMVLYVDCDMYFFNDYDFLFAELNDASVILTPNWINSDPLVDKESFFSLFTSGFFSAGFIGANQRGLEALNWWATACHFMMGEHIPHGIRGDQKYLDIFPLKFESTKIIRHRGCNIGAWNYDECKRVPVNGTVLINGEFPIIFIHFDDMMVKGILRGYDKFLLPHLRQYQQQFETNGYQLSDFIRTVDTHAAPHMIKKIKWKLRIKSRLKRVLYKLSQQI